MDATTRPSSMNISFHQEVPKAQIGSKSTVLIYEKCYRALRYMFLHSKQIICNEIQPPNTSFFWGAGYTKMQAYLGTFFLEKISNAESINDINKTETAANTCILYVCSQKTRVHNNIYMNRYEALLEASKNQD
jgi:hypothetical protein